MVFSGKRSEEKKRSDDLCIKKKVGYRLLERFIKRNQRHEAKIHPPNIFTSPQEISQKRKKRKKTMACLGISLTSFGHNSGHKYSKSWPKYDKFSPKKEQLPGEFSSPG